MILGQNQIYATPEDAVNSLYHHGVKGMKWGVRKEEKFGDRSAKAGDPVEVAKAFA